MEDFNKPVWQLTIGEFMELLDSRTPKIEEKNISQNSTSIKYVYGLAGLAKLIGCSINHASKLKSCGVFDEAIIQNGRKIIVNSEKAIELFKNYNK